MKEKCAVIGVYSPDQSASRLAHFGLFALQHRGQESSGIVSSTSRKSYIHKGMGLVAQVFKEKDFKKLRGEFAIGHNRYSTSLGSKLEHCQPVIDEMGSLSLAHNGNLPSTRKLKRFLKSKNLSIKGLNDSELMHKAIRYFLKKGDSLEESIISSYPLFTGAFSLVIMSKNKIAAVRDRCGIRPLSIGRLNNGYVVASETCALDVVGAKYERDVRPGEMVIIDRTGLSSYQILEGKQQLDIFEFVYFARADSMLLGKSVYEVRHRFGELLAEENKIKADVVIPVPESSIPVAIGFAQKSGIPYEYGLSKNRYIGRTFIMPERMIRESSINLKLSAIPAVIKNKRVIVIDDSIVRGTTSKKIVDLIKNAGAKEVHLMISCPPVKFPDFYGIDTPNQSQLIAAKKSIEEIRQFIGADSLHYLSYECLIAATGISEDNFCTSCFTGNYPIDIAENKKNINQLPKKLAVLISNAGTGTNLQAIIDGIENGEINGKIEVVISDKEDAVGLQRAKKHKINFEINKDKNLLIDLLRKYKIEYVCLAGWKQIITDEVIDKYKNKIINTHPGLIPDTPNGVVKSPDGTNALWNKGKFTSSAMENFLHSKSTYAGCTNHLLSEEFDFGLVLGRCFEKIKLSDNAETLYKRLKIKENKLYVKVLKKICE